MNIKKLSIIGSGAWGTALAQLATLAGNDVILWGRDARTIAAINKNHENATYLTDTSLDPKINATTNLTDISDSDALLIAVPAQSVRNVVKELIGFLKPQIPIICCSKGLEIGTGSLMSELLHDLLPHHSIGCLSGPTFAVEAIQRMPTAATIAFKEIGIALDLAKTLQSKTFRPYASTDLIGAQVGGALKNILAIACGISTGLGFGENTRAALITRGLAEVNRFSLALGGYSATTSSLASLGDLVLSCSSPQSRNFRFGEALAKGNINNKQINASAQLVEGWHSAIAVAQRGEALGIELPICETVNNIIHHDGPIHTAIEGLMNRPVRREFDDNL